MCLIPSFRTCGLPMLLLVFLTTYWLVFKGKHPEEERKWRITGGTKVVLLQSKAIHRTAETADVLGHQFLWPQQKDFRQGAHNSTLEEEWKGNTLRRENGSSQRVKGQRASLVLQVNWGSQGSFHRVLPHPPLDFWLIAGLHWTLKFWLPMVLPHGG